MRDANRDMGGIFMFLRFLWFKINKTCFILIEKGPRNNFQKGGMTPG
jgi:hypothetical protein